MSKHKNKFYEDSYDDDDLDDDPYDADAELRMMFPNDDDPSSISYQDVFGD